MNYIPRSPVVWGKILYGPIDTTICVGAAFSHEKSDHCVQHFKLGQAVKKPAFSNLPEQAYGNQPRDMV
jgi:hypothetical protein